MRGLCGGEQAGGLVFEPLDFGGEDGVGGTGEDELGDVGVEGGEGGGGVVDVLERDVGVVIGAAEEVSNPQNKVGVITASTATTPLALSLAAQ